MSSDGSKTRGCIRPGTNETTCRGRKSSVAGWERAFDKYSSISKVDMSPVKMAQANLKPVRTEVHEVYSDLHIWALNMTEKFFYDNAFLLLSMSKTNTTRMAKCLRRNFIGVDMKFFESLKDVTLLGKGAYGSVYCCEDQATGVKYAVKYLSAEFKEYINHTENLLDYMRERNPTIRSMDCPFIVRFYHSLQVRGKGHLFLFFEFCLGDLSKYISMISFKEVATLSKMLDNNDEELIQELYGDDPDYLEVSLVYIFELFCGLDFLVQCNIIHQDIKPDNVMISSSLHLKIGDFGLVYKTRTVVRETNSLLVNVEEIDKIESSNYNMMIVGTKNYQDFEQQMMLLDLEEGNKLDAVLNDRRKFNSPGISYEDEDLEPTFLVDTWAAGVIAIQLLLRGFEIFNQNMVVDEILTDVPRTDFSEYVVHLVGRQYIYGRYIHGGLHASGGASFRDLMLFLASIFKPRKSRCDSFTSEKKIMHYCKRVTMRYVNLDKIENFKPFKERNFTRSNITMRSISEIIRKLYDYPQQPLFANFKMFLSSIGASSWRTKNLPRILNIEPGVTMNNFW